MQTEKIPNDQTQLLDEESELVLIDEKRRVVEEKVAECLKAKYQIDFNPKTLPLEKKIDGVIVFHKFNLVSADNQIVAEVKDHVITLSGNISSAKILDTYCACEMLEKVSANKRLLVLTDFGFYQSFRKNSDDRISRKIEIVWLPI